MLTSAWEKGQQWQQALGLWAVTRLWQLAVGLWVAMQKSSNHVGMFLQEGLTGSACGAGISAARVR